MQNKQVSMAPRAVALKRQRELEFDTELSAAVRRAGMLYTRLLADAMELGVACTSSLDATIGCNSDGPAVAGSDADPDPDDQADDEQVKQEEEDLAVARIVGLPVKERKDQSIRRLVLAFARRCKRHLRGFRRELAVFETAPQIAQQLLPVVGPTAGLLSFAFAGERGVAQGHPIAVLTGAPGSGKSTQVPQLLADAGLVRAARGHRLLVVEPHPTIASALARHVTDEWHGPGVADSMRRQGGGFEIGLALHKEQALQWDPATTSVLFVDEDTAMTMLAAWKHRKVRAGASSKSGRARLGVGASLPSVDEFSLVMVDEAHVRSARCDALLGMLVDSVNRNRDCMGTDGVTAAASGAAAAGPAATMRGDFPVRGLIVASATPDLPLLD